MKKLLSLGMLLLLVNLLVCNAYASGINVSVDQKNVLFSDAAPFIDQNSRTLVPLRAIADAMGLDVEWDKTASAAIFTKVYTLQNTPYSNADYFVGKEKITFTIGSKQARIEAFFYSKNHTVKDADDMDFSSNGWTDIAMDTAAIIRDSRSYAPVKYLADAFKFEVNWNSVDKIVEISSTKVPDEIGLSIETVASTDAYYAWIYHTSKDSTIKSVKVLEVSKGDGPLSIRSLTEDETATINELLPELGVDGKFITGVVVNSLLEFEHAYKYTFKLQVTFENGEQQLVIYDNYIYFDGAGGII